MIWYEDLKKTIHNCNINIYFNQKCFRKNDGFIKKPKHVANMIF